MTEPRIPIFSSETRIGSWVISTEKSTFDISAVTYGFPYFLTNSRFNDFELSTNRDLYTLVVAVAITTLVWRSGTNLANQFRTTYETGQKSTMIVF